MKPKIIAALFCVIGIPLLIHAEDVQVDDLGTKVVVIGKLGKPLGTVVTVEGQLMSDPEPKNGQIIAVLRANKTDGQALSPASNIALLFRHSGGVPELHSHDLVKITGYEAGAFIGTPSAVRDQMGRDASPFDWKFETTFHVVTAETVPDPKP